MKLGFDLLTSFHESVSDGNTLLGATERSLVKRLFTEIVAKNVPNEISVSAQGTMTIRILPQKRLKPQQMNICLDLWWLGARIRPGRLRLSVLLTCRGRVRIIKLRGAGIDSTVYLSLQVKIRCEPKRWAYDAAYLRHRTMSTTLSGLECCLMVPTIVSILVLNRFWTQIWSVVILRWVRRKSPFPSLLTWSMTPIPSVAHAIRAKGLVNQW